MSLILSRLQCPWCQTPVTKGQLKADNQLKAYLNRQPIACPHCQQPIALPERAEKMISSGLFMCVVLAPLFMIYNWLNINPFALFALGTALVAAGIYFQKLQKVTEQEPPHE
jgi:endogenous inhibitor of DNA gyrase (YacG/DUF329 family)